MKNTVNTGERGEQLVAEYLRRAGYRILEQNYAPKRTRQGGTPEIDIIAGKGDVVTFFEVKTLTVPMIRRRAKRDNCPAERGGDSSFAPEDKVGRQKLRNIQKAARIWLQENDMLDDTPWQIDVVSVRLSQDGTHTIEHFEDVAVE